MKKYVKWMDSKSKIVKIIFALPVINILWQIYRLARSINKKNILGIVLAIVLLFVGPFFVFVLDLITLVLKNKVIWID